MTIVIENHAHELRNKYLNKIKHKKSGLLWKKITLFARVQRLYVD